MQSHYFPLGDPLAKNTGKTTMAVFHIVVQRPLKRMGSARVAVATKSAKLQSQILVLTTDKDYGCSPVPTSFGATDIQVCIHVHIRKHIHIPVWIYVHTHPSINIHTCIYKYMCIYIHIYIHTHVYKKDAWQEPFFCSAFIQ